jgi:hypothetical protein
MRETCDKMLHPGRFEGRVAVGRQLMGKKSIRACEKEHVTLENIELVRVDNRAPQV